MESSTVSHLIGIQLLIVSSRKWSYFLFLASLTKSQSQKLRQLWHFSSWEQNFKGMNGSEITAQGTHWNDNQSSLTGLSFPIKSNGASNKVIKEQDKSMDPHEKLCGLICFPRSNPIPITVTQREQVHKIKTVYGKKKSILSIYLLFIYL